MEGPEQLNVNTTAIVIFLLILSALGILWTVSCSWLTGRKKRQRVGNNGNVQDLVLDITSPMTRNKDNVNNSIMKRQSNEDFVTGKRGVKARVGDSTLLVTPTSSVITTDFTIPTSQSCTRSRSPCRYSSAEQIIIFPINDLGQSLHVPTIVITPPTPLGTPVDVSSLQSDSSIGTAEDLIQVNGDINDVIDTSDETVTETANGMLKHLPYIRDSMRNILASGQSIEEGNVALHDCYCLTDSELDTTALCRNETTSCSRLDGSPAVIVINSSHAINSDDDNEDQFSIDDSYPRPRLSSMEPGTKKPDFQLSDGKTT